MESGQWPQTGSAGNSYYNYKLRMPAPVCYVDYYALEIVVTMLMLRTFADPILLPANCVNLLRSRTIWIATAIAALG